MNLAANEEFPLRMKPPAEVLILITSVPLPPFALPLSTFAQAALPRLRLALVQLSALKHRQALSKQLQASLGIFKLHAFPIRLGTLLSQSIREPPRHLLIR